MTDVQMVRTSINGRWELLLPEHRHLRESWPWWEATRLAAEHHVIAQLALLAKRPVVWCVGAEEGDFPALYSSWGADVVLAEPNPLVWPNIKAIWEANDLRPPLLSFAGFLTDESRDPWMAHSGGWPECAGGPVIGDHGFCRVEERPDIQATTIDTIVGFGVAPPDVITIDVEGAETHVLQGAQQTIAEHRPHVFVSIHEPFQEAHYDILHGTAAVMDLLPDDYEMKFLTHDHESHWWFKP